MNYRPLVAEVFRQPWAILPEKLQSIADLIALKVSGELTDAEIQAKFSAGPRPSAKSSGSIAVIPIHGAITPHASLFTMIFGGTPLDTLAADFRQAVADPNVSAIVLDIDSPGGAVAGLPEMAAEILDARKDKKIVAHATTAASAIPAIMATTKNALLRIVRGVSLRQQRAVKCRPTRTAATGYHLPASPPYS